MRISDWSSDVCSSALFSSQRRTDIGAAAARLVDGALDGWTAELGEDALVLLRYAIRHARDRVIDEAVLDAQLQTMIRGWNTAVEAALRSAVGADRKSVVAGRRVLGRVSTGGWR